MSLDLYVHAEVNVGVFLPGGHRRVLHWVQIYTVQICRHRTHGLYRCNRLWKEKGVLEDFQDVQSVRVAFLYKTEGE